MKKIAVLFSGDGSNLKFILENLHNINLNVVVAITNNPYAKGISFCKEYNIPYFIYNSKEIKREELDKLIVKKINEYNVDLTVLAGYMRILTPFFVNNIRAINLHPSFLPNHKGLNAIENSYYDNNLYGGVSVHYVSEELDNGNIVYQEKIFKKNLSLEEYIEEVKFKEKIILKKAILFLII